MISDSPDNVHSEMPENMHSNLPVNARSDSPDAPDIEPQDQARLEAYLVFARRYPHVFVNDPDPGSIQIILDPEALLAGQQVLYQNARQRDVPRHWYDIGIVAEDAWVVVIRDLVRFPGGAVAGYIRSLNRNSGIDCRGQDVVILPVLKDRVLLLRHYRHEDRRWHYEIPRGFGERGLAAADNARKELLEETGLQADRLQLIGGRQPDGTLSRVAYFWAAVSGEVTIDPEEGIERTMLADGPAFKNMIEQGLITDAYTINAWAYAAISGLL